jgi:signal transduction histidine kinase
VLAETGTLAAQNALFPAGELFANLEAVFSSDTTGEGRRIEIECARDIQVYTDQALLLRVLVNMVRNGLEAVPPGGIVRVWCERLDGGPPGDRTRGDRIRFNVWNDGVIPPTVQARIFQRSFSTKAERGRGLGTYGMKLLGERVLGGEVSFTSDVDSGTVFSIAIR